MVAVCLNFSEAYYIGGFWSISMKLSMVGQAVLT